MIDGADPVVARRFWEIGRDAEAAYRAYDFYWPWDTARVTLREGRADTASDLLGAFDDEDRMVAVAMVSRTLFDNPHLAFLTVYVDPLHQRRGIGRALAAEGERVARGHGRRTVFAEACSPTGEESAGHRFLRAVGYAVAIEDGLKVVELDATEPTWDAIEAEVAPRSAGYTLVSWRDAVPEELMEGFCRLQEAFVDEAPMGELDIEREVWDEERVRKREASNISTGRHEVATAALAADGTMVGLTEIVLNAHAPHRGFQSGTLVLREHRGHALGLAMKIRNQRELRAAQPECRILMTGNAGVNVAMNAVNDRLGYRLVERCVEMQKHLDVA